MLNIAHPYTNIIIGIDSIISTYITIIIIGMSFSMFWPAIRLLGCHFHFLQLVWKKITQNSSLKTHMLLAFFHSYFISKVWSRASILGTLRKSDQSTISYTDYICSPPF